jgi:hypothetical protein
LSVSLRVSSVRRLTDQVVPVVVVLVVVVLAVVVVAVALLWLAAFSTGEDRCPRPSPDQRRSHRTQRLPQIG